MARCVLLRSIYWSQKITSCMFNTQGKGNNITNSTKFSFDILQELSGSEKHVSVTLTYLPTSHKMKYPKKCIGPKIVSQKC